MEFGSFGGTLVECDRQLSTKSHNRTGNAAFACLVELRLEMLESLVCVRVESNPGRGSNCTRPSLNRGGGLAAREFIGEGPGLLELMVPEGKLGLEAGHHLFESVEVMATRRRARPLQRLECLPSCSAMVMILSPNAVPTHSNMGSAVAFDEHFECIEARAGSSTRVGASEEADGECQESTAHTALELP